MSCWHPPPGLPDVAGFRIVQSDGQVLPVAFAAFRPSCRQAQGPAPEMPASGGVFEVSALIHEGLDAHSQAATKSGRTVPAEAADSAEAG
jgi:hypothetical protein